MEVFEDRPLAAFYDDKVGVVMDLEGYHLYRVAPDLAKAVDDGREHVSLSNLRNLLPTELPPPPSEDPADYSVSKVILHIAHACNLKCTYCYADFGTYGLPRKLMTPDMAVGSLRTLYQKRGWVNKVMFFGGEPTLNTRVMNDVYDFFEEEHGRHPNYGTVSNLTILNDRVVDTVNRLHMSVTASFDGPKEVNDQYRVTVTGKGTHDTIVKNIEALRRETGQPTGVEVTYSDAHFSRGLKPWDVIDYTYERTGVPYVLLAFVENTDSVTMRLESRGLIPLIEEYARETVRRLAAGRRPVDVNLAVMLAMTLNPDPVAAAFWCTTGLKTIAITPDGDLHPCQIFVGHGMAMGNIRDNLESPEIPVVQQQLMTARKDHFDVCNHCYGKWSCGACTGSLYRETGSMYPQSEHHCGSHRAMIRAALLEAVSLSSEQWNTFLGEIASLLNANIASDEEHV